MLLRLCVLLLLVLPVGSATTAQAPPTIVRAAVAEMRKIQNHHRVTGSLRAVARGEVSALEEGRIVEITVREGATVHKGDVIAKLDARRLNARQSELIASLSGAKAQVEQRKVELSASSS